MEAKTWARAQIRGWGGESKCTVSPFIPATTTGGDSQLACLLCHHWQYLSPSAPASIPRLVLPQGRGNNPASRGETPGLDLGSIIDCALQGPQRAWFSAQPAWVLAQDRGYIKAHPIHLQAPYSELTLSLSLPFPVPSNLGLITYLSLVTPLCPLTGSFSILTWGV